MEKIGHYIVHQGQLLPVSQVGLKPVKSLALENRNATAFLIKFYGRQYQKLSSSQLVLDSSNIIIFI